ncbi:DUF484 family protein [Shewanella surugensis]|uniref:DUF484 family protein n=1 Tax=Shewanella surugensis TaxID=212020 RepID=A0ABT0LGS6_9GAMM|nr:DUF484 family protein [Shewanella surugensis]MCL1126660.1 DUF484 family protein [Shewanella surugensis]
MTDLLHMQETAPFDEILIREYLRENPDFFARFPELLTGMRIPHQERGTVSLVERQQSALRQQVQQLEEEITALMTMATRNEQIYMFNNALSMKLLECDGISDLRQILSVELKNQFNFSHVRLISVHDIDSELAHIWQKRLNQGYYFGRLTQAESRRLFGSDVGSVALSRLSKECGQVIFAIATQDPSHFQPDMDHLLLDQIKQLLDHLVPKC